MLYPRAGTVTDPARLHTYPRTGGGAGIPDAMGEFLSAYEWSHFVTLTTRTPRSQERILRVFEQRFVRPLARVTQTKIPYFYVVESVLPAGGFPHIHALLGSTEPLPNRLIEKTWTEGFSRVTKYDPRKGAAWYLTKSIESIPDSYGLSRRFPKRESRE